MKVLLVDDDRDLLDLTSYALHREGHSASTATDGEQALRLWKNNPPDIIVLDANLPKLSGYEVCRRIRLTSDTPIIMLTARDEEDEILRGLRMGADDYMTKPFSPKVLLARMATVLRRCTGQASTAPESVITVGQLTLDPQCHEVRRDGVAIQFTPIEFRILYMLAINAGRVVSYARLVEYAWGYDGGDASLLKTHIFHIREKLQWRAVEEEGIRVLPRVGYSLGRVIPARNAS